MRPGIVSFIPLLKVSRRFVNFHNYKKQNRFVPPQTFWEDFQRAPESPGFWSTVRDLPQEVLISVGVAFLAFLSYLVNA